MARSADFAQGLQRVLEGARKYRVALMCSEHDPLDCHRCLLVGRALAERGVSVKHILADGAIVDHRDVEDRLLKSEGRESTDLFLYAGTSGWPRPIGSVRARLPIASSRAPKPRRWRNEKMTQVNVATIGFTKTDAERFFERIFDGRGEDGSRRAAAQHFAARGLRQGRRSRLFPEEDRRHRIRSPALLAPTDPMLKAYKKEKGDWGVYEERFLALMAERKIEERLKPTCSTARASSAPKPRRITAIAASSATT